MSDTFKIKVECEVSRQFLLDVMVTAVESGYDAVRYWGSFEHVERDGDLNVTLMVIVEDEEPDEAHVITPSDLVNAIEQVLNGTCQVSHEFTDMISRAVRDDDADIDATGADILVQVACFGEVVYG